jgi:hemolysin D
MKKGFLQLQYGWYRIQTMVWERLRGIDRWIDLKFGDKAASKDRALAREFMPDAAIIAEAPVPVSTHMALYIVLVLLIFAILWSIFGSVDRLVVAQGTVATRTPNIVMQPYTTSRITRIHVRPGDHVHKGEVLVSFDPAFAQADKASLEQKVRGLTAQIERIYAELNGKKSFSAVAGDSPERRTQAEIFLQETAGYSAEMSERDKRVGGIEAQLKATNDSIDGLRQQVASAKKIVDIQQYLMREGAGVALDVIKAQSSEVDAEIRLSNALGDSKKYSQQRAEIEAERQTFLNKWRSDHNQQLVQARQDLAEASETLNKAQRMKDLTEVIAPVDATVLEIADRSVGSVLREAETLVTLVPDAADLYVQANLSSRDVSYIKAGDHVQIKLEAYPFQRYGTLGGNLSVIGADSISLKSENQSQDDNHSQLVYRVQVRLTETARELVNRGIRLRPGLVATAEITAGKRSIASYILYPILRLRDESLREP